MPITTRQSIVRSLTLAAALGLFAFVVSLSLAPGTVSALPPRPTAVPTPTVASSSAAAGASIQLRVTSASPNVWTVVQWQDALGGWHDVEGWRGSLDDGSLKTWWVNQADFGKGPFRWLVYGADRSKPLGTSASFNLPRRNREVVKVEVTITP